MYIKYKYFLMGKTCMYLAKDWCNQQGHSNVSGNLLASIFLL